MLIVLLLVFAAFATAFPSPANEKEYSNPTPAMIPFEDSSKVYYPKPGIPFENSSSDIATPLVPTPTPRKPRDVAQGVTASASSMDVMGCVKCTPEKEAGTIEKCLRSCVGG